MPALQNQIAVYMSPEDTAWLNERAKELGMSRNSLLTSMVAYLRRTGMDPRVGLPRWAGLDEGRVKP